MNLPPYSVRITLSLTEALSMSHLRSNVTNTRSSQRAYLCLAGAGYSRHQRQRQSYAQCLHAQQASNKLSPSTDTAQRRLRQLTIRTRLSDQTYQIVADGTSRFNSQWLRPKGWRSAELVCGCRSMSNLVEPGSPLCNGLRGRQKGIPENADFVNSYQDITYSSLRSVRATLRRSGCGSAVRAHIDSLQRGHDG